ncbi:MAG: hypothetical protein ABI972_16580 [Acidobacteriota bacterium]
MRLLLAVVLFAACALAVPLDKAPLADGWFPIVIVEVTGPGQAPGWTAVDVVEVVRGDHIEGRWQASLGAGMPHVGDRLLLFYARSRDSGRIILPLHTYEANDENVRYVRTHMAAGPRSRWIQFPFLVIAIVGAPLAGLSAIIFRKSIIGIAGIAVGIAVGLAYETGVPRQTHIRADWLMMIPALFGAALMTIVAWYRERAVTTLPSSPTDPT